MEVVHGCGECRYGNVQSLSSSPLKNAMKCREKEREIKGEIDREIREEKNVQATCRRNGNG